MNRDGLQTQYADKSNIELLLIAMDDSSHWTSSAINAATSILLSRCKHTTNIQQIWSEEIDRLFDLAQRCSVCQSPEIAYTGKFYLCSIGTPDATLSTIGIASALAFGIGLLSEKYSAVEIEFRHTNLF